MPGGQALAAPASEAEYRFFLSTPTARQWERIGLKRRAGVAVPLFSVWSGRSAGVGDFADLEALADWCASCGMSIVQLLPLNDTGSTFRPYDAESAFALDPAYADLDSVAGVPPKARAAAADDVRRLFPPGGRRVDWRVKNAKLEALRRMFEKRAKTPPREFESWKRANGYWLEDYALYRLAKRLAGGAGWESWEERLRNRDAGALERLARDRAHAAELEFTRWVQWQLARRFRAARLRAAKKGVLFMGDLPFLVSRDSAEVWARPEYFQLDRVAGAPPDAFFAKGQRWGMPPYRWDRIAADGYAYVAERLRVAEGFYDLYRIDHVVGLFRLWTIPAAEPLENAGMNGGFEPADEREWEAHGRRLLGMMVEKSAMLPCAEDLGTVPPCAYAVLRELGIPGIEVQRWAKDWDGTFDFRPEGGYRPNSAAVISTHDMTPLLQWWQYEIGTVDEETFRRKCQSRGLSYEGVRDRLFDPERSSFCRLRWRRDVSGAAVLLERLGLREEEARDFLSLWRGSFDEEARFLRAVGLTSAPRRSRLVEKALEHALRSASIFSVQLFQDWLALDEKLQDVAWDSRINFPGTLDPRNWTLAMPAALERLKTASVNRAIRALNARAGRI
jgi:4-alpha-glucanotransferase